MTNRLSCRAAVLGLPVIFTVGAGLYYVLGVGWMPWTLLPVPMLVWLIAAPGRNSPWAALVPFLILLLCYQSLSVFSRSLEVSAIHVVQLIEWERMLSGGAIPAAVLQRHLGGPIATWLIDPLSNLLYLSHFVTPVVIGLVLWKRNQRLYWEFVAGFLFLSFLGFATYILFPAAPPWWASERGYLEGLEQVDLDRFLLAGVTANQAPNPVAAVPSLHCAYPLYFFLILRPLLGKRSAWLLLLTFGIVFSVVYLGHHYLIDAWIGFAYGLAGWGFVRFLSTPFHE